MSTAHTADLDDPDLQERIREALASKVGRERFNRFLRTPADLRRKEERIDKLFLGTFVSLVLTVTVLALLALYLAANEPAAAVVYGTVALVASGGAGKAFVLLRMHRARMRRDGGRSA